MATVVDVAGGDTPNSGRVQWNANINAINAETSANTATLAAVVGDVVGTSQTQTLTNKTMVSSYRGGSNTFSISRRDLESTSLFLVTSDSGSVSDVDVTGASQYSLQILGDNGLDTYVTSNVLYVRNSPTSILNESGQVLGVGVASVTSPNVAEFGGSVKINNRLAVGAQHSAGAAVGLHLKENAPEFRIETVASGIAYQTFLDGSGDNFKWTTDFTPGTEYLRMAFNGTELFTTYGVGGMTFTQDITLSKVGGSHTVVGDLTVDGILTAGTLNAIATEVQVTSGPITISGAVSSWNETVPHDQLATLINGKILVGNGSNVAEAVWMSGDVGIVAGGATSIANQAITMAKMSAQSMNTLLGGTDSGVAAKTLHVNSDVAMSYDASTFLITVKDNIIDNANIKSSAAIQMSKTAFAVNISGMTLNGNTLELDGPKADILYRDIPVGTIIAYAGDVTINSGQVKDEVLTGWLHCNGWTLDGDSKWDDLKAAIGSAWGGAYQLPDLRGAFMRGIDINRGLDPDYATRTGGGVNTKVGSYQSDEVGPHSHELAQGWANDLGTPGAYHPSTSNTFSGYPDTKVNDGDETRPLNYGVIYLIKY